MTDKQISPEKNLLDNILAAMAQHERARAKAPLWRKLMYRAGAFLIRMSGRGSISIEPHF